MQDSGASRPLKPSRMPWHSQPRPAQASATERITAFRPGASPPPSYREQARRYAPETWQRIVAATDRAVVAGESFEFAVELSRDDGSSRALIVRGEPCFDSTGRVERVIGTAQDVTDLEGIRRELLQATARHRLATSAASIGVWDWDIEAGCELVLLSKFGRLERDGGGLREAFVAAIEAGVPVLTSVSTAFVPAWQSFAAPWSTTVAADADSIEAWWQTVRPPPPGRRAA